MSKNLSLKKETLVSLQTVDLDTVYGGVAARPTATAVSSAKPGGGGFAHPTATAVSSAHRPQPTSSAIHHGPVSSVHHGGGSLSSVHHGGGSLSSVMPGHKVSSAKPNF
jgi:hypothetical protein